jgi:hypothetical protein
MAIRSLVIRCLSALQARLGPDPKRVAGWATLQHTTPGNTVYIRLLFIADGTVLWDKHPTVWTKDGFKKCPNHHWELDD